MRQPSLPLTFPFPCFPMPLDFDLCKLSCVVLFVLMQHFVCVLCSLLHQHELYHSVTTLHLDWSDILVRCSAAGLGQLHRSDAN